MFCLLFLFNVFSQQERGGSRWSGSSRSNLSPSKTLFVINFDRHETRTRDLERHFEPYGKIISVRIRRNFALVQYEYQEDAIKALDATNMRLIFSPFSPLPVRVNLTSFQWFFMGKTILICDIIPLLCSKLMDQVISVEYAVRDDDERRDGYGSDRDCRRSPERRRHSPSPYRRERGSPDYGRGGASPYHWVRGSANYVCGGSPMTHHRERTSPDYGCGPNHSPHCQERSRSHGDCRRSCSESQSQSSYEEQRGSPENGCVTSSSPYKRQRDLSECSHSPYRRGRDLRDCSHSPYERKSERALSDEGQVSPQSSEEREKLGPENGHGRLPRSSPEARDSPPNHVGAESPANGLDYWFVPF